jgi:hypothetical protein
MHKGLSDHNAQLVTIHDIALSSTTFNYIKIRKFDKFSITDLNFNLSFEIWSDVTFVCYVYTSFPTTSAKSYNTRKICGTRPILKTNAI